MENNLQLSDMRIITINRYMSMINFVNFIPYNNYMETFINSETDEEVRRLVTLNTSPYSSIMIDTINTSWYGG